MLETQEFPQTPAKRTSAKNELHDAFVHLQTILLEYLEARPHLSLNGLAKRCAVSEPTLRRIRKGQLKTLPEITTIIDMLSYMTQESDARKIAAHFPGPIEAYLKERSTQVNALVEIEVSESLTNALRDPVKYLIYKLSVNETGVGMEKVVELFGSYGEKQVQALIQDDLLEEKEGNYHGKIPYFSLMDHVFVEHFKATADFIKPEKLPNAPKNMTPLFVNFSEGVNKKGYSEILKIQRQALKKIRKILADKDCHGPIPSFFLCALDTIDPRSANEF